MNTTNWEQVFSDVKLNQKVTIIENAKEDKIYVNNFKDGKGKYVNVYINDFQVSSQIQISLSYINVNQKIVGIEITRVKKGAYDGSVKLSIDGYAQLISILEFLKSIDIQLLSTRKITLQDDLKLSLDEEAKKKIRTAFSDESNRDFLLELISQADIHDAIRTMFTNDDKKMILIEQIKSGLITSHDIVNVGYRKEQLSVFEEMLKICDDEKDWQLFFEQNQWIFGYGLDYKFNYILQREYSTGSKGLDAKGEAIGDFILTDSQFTVLVELKTPRTKLFSSEKFRNGCWKISNDLANVTSQVLAQKHEVTVNFDKLAEDVDKDISLYDPKAIVVIGNTQQFNAECVKESRWKKRTFELYRRNLRNVEIITYDELYARAKFIVENSK